MKYGQIAGNKSINAMIYRCFEDIHKDDVRKFVKKFDNQLQDEILVMHTFRELILGAYLALNGFNVRYGHTVGIKTPDWCVLDESSSLKAIVELTNFHLNKVAEDDINEKLQTGDIWVGWLGPNDDRLYFSIQHKASIYRTLVVEHSVPYVISIFGEFNADVNLDELNQCLFAEESGLFEQYPMISGVLFFEERSGQYVFTYIPNPNPVERIGIPSGEY